VREHLLLHADANLVKLTALEVLSDHNDAP